MDYILYREPSAYNGYTKLDVDKIEMVVSYFAKQNPQLTESGLRRLLWYADALSCMKYQKAITGMVYRREGSGVWPIGHSGFLNLDKINIREETKEGCEPILYVYPNEDVNESVLSASDRDILDTVAVKFKGYKPDDIACDMNQEKAYAETKPGEIIIFELEGKIRAFN